MRKALRAEASVYEAGVQALGVKTDVYKAQTFAYVGAQRRCGSSLRAEPACMKPMGESQAMCAARNSGPRASRDRK